MRKQKRGPVDAATPERKVWWGRKEGAEAAEKVRGVDCFALDGKEGARLGSRPRGFAVVKMGKSAVECSPVSRTAGVPQFFSLANTACAPSVPVLQCTAEGHNLRSARRLSREFEM